MEPAFHEGDLIVGENERPARIGDDVLVLLMDNPAPSERYRRLVLLGQLVARTAEGVQILQHNQGNLLDVPGDAIRRVDRVLRISDVLLG